MSAVDTMRTGVRRAVYERKTRRRVYAAGVVIFALLTLFPKPYVSRAKIVPQDTSTVAASTTTLLGALGSGSTSIGSLLTGGRPSNDLYLIIARSDGVAEKIIKKLHLIGPGAYDNFDDAKTALDRSVDVHSLLGGVVEVETKTFSPAKSQRITEVYVEALSEQLASFGRQIIDNKKLIVARRIGISKKRVDAADARLASFRREHNLVDANDQLAMEVALRANLQGELQAQLVMLREMQGVRGPDSPELKSIQARIASIREQISKSAMPTVTIAGPNIAGLTPLMTQYYNLVRDFRLAQGNYEVYVKSIEQIEVEQLAAESASYVQVIDPAHLDSERHYNIWALASMLTILVLAAFTEWYAPMTGLTVRPNSAKETDSKE